LQWRFNGPSFFQYIISNHGIDTEASYPYQAQGPLNCRFKRAAVGATLMSYHDVKSGSEADLLTAVEKKIQLLLLLMLLTNLSNFTVVVFTTNLHVHLLNWTMVF